MTPSELKISPSVESYDELTDENYRNHYIAEKHIVSELSKIPILDFNSTNLRLGKRLCQIFVLYDCIFYTFRELSRKRASRSGRFIVSMIQLVLKCS